MCIYPCDTSPCVSIATSALKSAPSHAPPVGAGRGYRSRGLWARPRLRVARGALTGARQGAADRKSTRLNSSHDQISYAVFCLKKKKIQMKWTIYTDTDH